MPVVSECLNRRYKALDSLIRELNTSISSQNHTIRSPSDNSNVGIKLMCDFWNILKDDPDCNVPGEGPQRLGTEPQFRPKMYGPRRYMTYMAEDDKKCCNSNYHCESRSGGASPKRPISQANSDEWPLVKVLCNLKEAASYDKKCHVKVKELLETQKKLKEQITTLEDREKDGLELLKQADQMWLNMEESYKKKVAKTLASHQNLIAQLKEIEGNISKWRKNKKELQAQIENMDKVHREIIEDINRKKNDLKIIDLEIENLQNRVDSNNNDLVNIKKSMVSKKEASNARMANLANQITRMRKRTNEEINHKKNKEEEGSQYVREAREDLQEICKVLIKKKLENEDLRAERKGLLEELELLNKTADTCRERCKIKENNLKEEIGKLANEIANFKVKCIKCHVCTDTNDSRKLCTDCPRCAADRDCLYDDEFCTTDPNLDCVCVSVKQKFLDNVFDNMYTVLERQSKTNPGKAVADAVLECLKQSRNGKLTAEVRSILQDFILTTVKKNLNLTIVGGAVKTRCEMDPDTYKQLMLCLNKITPTKRESSDKGTDAKKEPCTHWGGNNECQCPKGPKACICTKKAPPPIGDPRPCPQDKEDIGPAKICPHGTSKVCGPDCGMQGKPGPGPSLSDVARWRPDPCSGPTCSFGQNMKAAQCMLGTETLPTQSKQSSIYLSNKSTASEFATCTCGSGSKSPCPCGRDTKQLKADNDKNCDRNKCKFLRSRPETRSPLARSIKTKPIPSIPNKVAVGRPRQPQKTVTKNNPLKSGSGSFGKALPVNVTKKFKILIGEFDDHFGVLSKTASGKLAVELKEKTIELIENKGVDKPYIYVSPRRTKSGQLILDFNNKDTNQNNNYKVRVRETQLGIKLLEMQKDLVDVIQDKKQRASQSGLGNKQNIDERKVTRNGSPSCGCWRNMNEYKGNRNRSPCCCCDMNGGKKTFNLKQNLKISDKKYSKHTSRDSSPVSGKLSELNSINDKFLSTENIVPVELIRKTSNSHANKVVNRLMSDRNRTCQTSNSAISEMLKIPESANHSSQDYTLEFEELFNKGQVITLKIKHKNSFIHTFSTLITETPCGILGVNLFKSLDLIPLDPIHPAYLTKTESGSYLLSIDNNNNISNVVLKECCVPDNVILIPTSSKITEKSLYKSIPNTDQGKIYKLKVAGYKIHPFALPAVLKTTASDNFMIILDKEFEKRYKKTVEDYVGKEKECFVYLNKTSSGYVIDLNTSGSIPADELNALLVKTSTGDIKVLLKGPVFEGIDTSTSKRSSMSSAQIFGELLGKLQPVSSREIHRENLRKTKLTDQNISSDSELYEHVNVNLKIKDNLHTDSSATMKKSQSGQYAIKLDKTSKESITDRLRSYLIANPEGRVPIKRTDSGQILLEANSSHDGKQQYGLLKVTSSGNICVIAAEEPIKQSNSGGNMYSKSSNAVDTRSLQFENVSKAVTTTCNARPDLCDCVSTKCVCSELQPSVDWFDNYCWITDYPGRSRHSIRRVKSKSSTNEKIKDTLPHIVIKPVDHSQPSCLKMGVRKCWLKSKSKQPIANLSESSFVSSRTKINGLPHIVLKPGNDNQPTCSKTGVNKQRPACYNRSQLPTKGGYKHCYFVTDSVCPYPKDTSFGHSSDDFLDISGFSAQQSQYSVRQSTVNDNDLTSNDRASPKTTETWDSLEFLPPQLPPFLSSDIYH